MISGEDLCTALFEMDTLKINNLKISHPNLWAFEWECGFVPYEVFSKGNYDVIDFAITHCAPNKTILNELAFGIRGRHPSEILVRRGKFEVLEQLVVKHGLFFKGTRVPWNFDFRVAFNPILTALEMGDNFLLKKATKFMPTKWSWEDIRREDGATPLQLALSKVRFDLVKTLLDAKAPVNQLGWCDLSPLRFAKDLQISEEIIQLLIKKGAICTK